MTNQLHWLTKTSMKVARGLSWAIIMVTIVLSLPAQAAALSARESVNAYQTYVIATYGGASLLPAVQQQLAGTGSSVSIYQDKLVLRTTPRGYQAVQQLLRQIDGVPQTLTVSVRVGNQSASNGSIQQSQVIITSHGERVNIGGYGRYGSQSQTQQGNSLYQVQTLSGRSASIGTDTLLSLATPYVGTIYNRYGQRAGSIWIAGQTLTTASQGIAVTPRVLPNGQVEVALNQVESKITTNQMAPIHTQRLNSFVTVPRGQWVNIGYVSQDQQQYNGGWSSATSNSMQASYPIQIMVQ